MLWLCKSLVYRDNSITASTLYTLTAVRAHEAVGAKSIDGVDPHVPPSSSIISCSFTAIYREGSQNIADAYSVV